MTPSLEAQWRKSGDASVRRLTTTVVIVTQDPDKLVHLLHSLCKQSLAPDEVVVVDDHSSGNYAAAFNGFREKLPLKTLVQKTVGMAASRNAGIRASNGDIVIFVSDDCEAHPDWVRDIVHPFYEDAQIGVVIGEIFSAHRCQTVVKALCAHEMLADPSDAAGASQGPKNGGPAPIRIGATCARPAGYLPRIEAGGSDPSGAGANIAVRRDVLRRTGNFDLHCSAGSDVDLSLRARATGFEAWFEPSARVTRFRDHTFVGMLGQWMRAGRDHAYLFRKHFPEARLQLHRPIAPPDGSRSTEILCLLDVPFLIPAMVSLSGFHLMNAALLVGMVLALLGAMWPAAVALLVAAAAGSFYVAHRFDRRRPIESLALCAMKHAADCVYVLSGFMSGIRNRVIYLDSPKSRRLPQPAPSEKALPELDHPAAMA